LTAECFISLTYYFFDETNLLLFCFPLFSTLISILLTWLYKIGELD